MQSTSKRNTVMGILTGIAMLLVVLGHLDMNELSVFGLFPYYGFHVLIFVFVSGYFYDPGHEAHVLKYIGHKALGLLVPYFIWNLIYGILSAVMSSRGFTYCSPFTVRNFFLEPFLGGHQFGLNFASWFVPALFMVEILNILIRRFMTLTGLNDERLSRIRLNADIILSVLFFILGIATVMLARGGHVWGYYKTPGRILLMMPVFEFGRVYKRHIESIETRIPDAVFLASVCALQFVLYLISDGLLNFSVVWCTSFSSYPFVPFLTAFCGIMFWLRISRILSSTFLGRMFDGIGAASFHIMMHHAAVFFAVNLIMMAVSASVSVSVPFDMNEFHSNVVYAYLPSGLYVWKIVYLTAGIGIPVLGAISGRHICNVLRSRKSSPRQR